MNHSRLFKELDLERYARIVQRILGHDHAGTVVFDGSGMPVWLSPGCDELQSDQYSRTLREARQAAGDAAQCACFHDPAAGSGFVYRSLGVDADQALGWLAVLWEGDSGAYVSSSTSASALVALDEVVPLMQGELQRIGELDEIAGELGERYNELNMLCRVDDPMQPRKECRDALSQQVRQFASHLEPDLAVLWVAQRELVFPAGALYRRDDKELNTWLHDLAHAAYQWFLNGNGPLGMNSLEDSNRQRLGVDGSYKLIGVPILDRRSVVSGVLVCANRMDRPDFTNSHRNLLEVAAERASESVREHQDELTGLMNRNGFQTHLVQLGLQRDAAQCSRVVCLINLDQFKIINVSYGISAGDEVLFKVAALLIDKVTGHGVAARLDADNFALLLENKTIPQAEQFARDVCVAIRALRFDAEDKCFTIGASAGVVALEDTDGSLGDLTQLAEVALVSAKEAGGHRVEAYQLANKDLVRRHQQLHWVEGIKHALDEGRFVLYCQRIQPLQGGEVHYELLVRMLDENSAIVPPVMFIPTAERYSLMPKLDRWVLGEALKQLSAWTPWQFGEPMSWGINLSGQSLNNAGSLAFLSEQVQQSPVPENSIYFEITETAAVQNFHAAERFMLAIQKAGCRFALDDFGSGLSSFAYLQRLPVDYLKVDGALVRNMRNNPVDQAMVSAVAEVGKVMGLKTIAEFVEDQETLRLLQTMGVDYAQGYVVMKPMPLAEELQRLRSSCAAEPGAVAPTASRQRG
jgi:diguanylate cyclase (GGDEF)-like protein